MQRVAWTDERLDDQAQHIDAGFDRVDRDIRELRGEMRGEFAEVRGEIGALRAIVIRGGGGIMAGLIGVIAAVLSHGA
jgi:hypothetical protein